MTKNKKTGLRLILVPLLVEVGLFTLLAIINLVGGLSAPKFLSVIRLILNFIAGPIFFVAFPVFIVIGIIYLVKKTPDSTSNQAQ